MFTTQPSIQQDISSETGLPAVGAVVIGRNEGERLRQCLESLVSVVENIVYVDSGSTDDSCMLAEALGVRVLPLDMSIPFTAARARNEGIALLTQQCPEIAFVQVVDGDCSIADGWMQAACEVLSNQPDIAIVCGRRRERAPAETKYNQLCDLEWNTPCGEAKACGGDALIRVSAFRSVDGFNASLIAGEEPEMCVRLRKANWKILRIDHDMSWHDAAMTTFGQFWKRAQRAGHAYAEGNAMHGAAPEYFRRREVRSILLWGGIVPCGALLAAIPTLGLSLLVAIAGYVRLYRRIRKHRADRGDSRDLASLYAWFTVIGKAPQLVGVLQYKWNRLRRKRSAIIEYK